MKPSAKTSMFLRGALVFLIAAGAFSFPSLTAGHGGEGKITGLWKGNIKFSGLELGIYFTISQNSDFQLQAVMDVPEQNAANVPVDIILFNNKTLRLEIIPIDGVFEGKLSEDEERINGTWEQSGMALPLLLERCREKPGINRPQEPVAPLPYTCEDISIENSTAGVTLSGCLTTPSSAGPFPAVLLISGTGPQDRDETVFSHRPFLVLADYLTRRGIAVLRVDDRGVGDSTGDFDKATALDFTEDALAGLNRLRSRDEIDQGAVGLIGHSEGGMIAAMAAARSPDIAFIVLLASPGLPIREMEYYGEARLLRENGAGEGLISRNRALQDSLFNVIAAETDSQVVQAKVTMVITDFFNKLSPKEIGIMGLSGDNLEAYCHGRFQRLHSPWFRFYLSYDPGTALRNVECPVLAVNGGKDVQVAADANLAAIKKALESGGNPEFNIRKLPGLNHLLQTAETGEISEYAKIEETVSPAALKIIGDWILRQTKTREQPFTGRSYANH